MSSSLTPAQKALLKEYGRLHRLHHSKVFPGNVKESYEEIKKEMARQSLTHKDYEAYEQMERYLRTADELIREEKREKASETSGIIKLVIGALLLLVGIGLSADTNFLFYGAIFSGIGLIAAGGMDLYYK